LNFGKKSEVTKEGNMPILIKDTSINMEMGCTAGVRFQARVSFSLLHSVQTGSGVHPVSYTMDIGGDFPVGKATVARS
jgi:hypothetical protein